MNYNWQQPHWPNFIYNSAQCKPTVYQYALAAGRLSGIVSQLDEARQYEIYIDLMATEAVHTHAIEDHRLVAKEVQTSIRQYLGINHPPAEHTDPHSDCIAQLMVDVRKSFTEPLTSQRLLQWQHMLLRGDTDPDNNPRYPLGQWRHSSEPLRIVASDQGVEQVLYQAPPADQIEAQINQFLQWYNDTNPMEHCSATTAVSGPVRAAIAHWWFETIHPFEHGNGRIGRAIAEQALAQDLGHPPLLSLSAQLNKDRRAYYGALAEAVGPSLNITHWVNWFTDCLLQAQQDEVSRVDQLSRKAVF